MPLIQAYTASEYTGLIFRLFTDTTSSCTTVKRPKPKAIHPSSLSNSIVQNESTPRTRIQNVMLRQWGNMNLTWRSLPIQNIEDNYITEQQIYKKKTQRMTTEENISFRKTGRHFTIGRRFRGIWKFEVCQNRIPRKWKYSFSESRGKTRRRRRAQSKEIRRIQTRLDAKAPYRIRVNDLYDFNLVSLRVRLR
jgi:hypothetical protein